MRITGSLLGWKLNESDSHTSGKPQYQGGAEREPVNTIGLITTYCCAESPGSESHQLRLPALQQSAETRSRDTQAKTF